LLNPLPEVLKNESVMNELFGPAATAVFVVLPTELWKYFSLHFARNNSD
jgi:hypothetical protein